MFEVRRGTIRGDDLTVPAPVTPRAVGERIAYAALPDGLRSWIDSELGEPVVEAAPQTGGMSPGPAARLVLADGRRYFVKAVGHELNTGTPRLFRHEIDVLRRLPPVDYRPSLVASYDDGDWLALVLEDVEGHHPNLSDPAQIGAAREVIRAQSRELTPDPVRIESETLGASVSRWLEEIRGVDEHVHELLPRWWLAHEAGLLARLATLPDRLPGECWCHLDIRDDNLLVRPDGSVVVLDWGMSRPGPPWVDEVLLDLHDVTVPVFDRRVSRIPAYGVPSDEGRQETVTDLLLVLGMSLAVISHHQAPPGLPRLMSFRRAESHRLLVGARRRLGL